MCTLSVLDHEDKRIITFNRDEQKSRPREFGLFEFGTAKLRELSTENLRAIGPRDPQGEGTWIAINEKSLVLALLNRYDPPERNSEFASDDPPVRKSEFASDLEPPLKGVGFLSRGQLVKELLLQSDIESCLANLEEKRLSGALSSYRGFRLFLGTVSQTSIVEWDGTNLTIEDPPRTAQPFLKLSSSVSEREITELRRNLFLKSWSNQDLASLNSIEALSEELRRIHFTTFNERPAAGVCMYRDDAQTLSVTQIVLSKQEALILHFDLQVLTQFGAPSITKVSSEHLKF